MSIRQLILRNFWLKALSFVTALLIWLVVQTQITGGNLALVFQPGATDTRSFTLQLHVLKTASDGRFIRVTPDTVTATVEGPKNILQRLTEGDLRAFVDLSTSTAPGPERIRVRVVYPDEIVLRQVAPSEVRVVGVERTLQSP
jgi:YbbR domain-containing protein